MINRTINLNSAAEAIEYIKEHQDELKRNEKDVLFFRGEAKQYATMLPSLFRQPEEEQVNFTTLIQSLSSYLLTDYLSPYIELKDDGPYYKGKWIGRIDWSNEFRSEPSYVEVFWQLQCLLQHYGWPTPWLDITFDPRAAIFFGAYDFSSMRLLSEGYGYLHIWSKSAIRSSDIGFETPLVDLKPISDVLSDALKIHSTRPQAQVAGSIRISHSNKHVEGELKNMRTTILFNRHDTNIATENLEYYFPNDPLLNELNHLEQLYFKYFEHMPSDSVGPGWSEYLDFLSRWEKKKRGK